MALGKHQKTNQLRIIGGKLKRTKLSFPSISGLRPTPDRIRETLFNWLQGDMHNSRCLDLFAGSGALGLESISRGAAFVAMVEKDSTAASSIKNNLNRLNIVNAVVYTQDVKEFLLFNQQSTRFDIVFLDPPYGDDVLTETMTLLEQQEWLSPSAKIYIEAPSDRELCLPPNWILHRQKKSGQVGYHLAIRKN